MSKGRERKELCYDIWSLEFLNTSDLRNPTKFLIGKFEPKSQLNVITQALKTFLPSKWTFTDFNYIVVQE